MNMVMQRNRGFSLLEIMVVVAILGVLAGIAVPIYSSYTQSARATECANEVSAIQLAEEEFFLVNNTLRVQMLPPLRLPVRASISQIP